MANRIQFRRDTSANWTRVNPVLEDGEPGLETDTNYIKYGDGNSTWTELAYASTGGSGNALVNNDATVSLGADGVLTLPYGSTILESTYIGTNSIRLKPNGGTSTQYLEIAPTTIEGNHVHLMAGSGTELFLGDDNHYVKLADTGNVVINSNDNDGNTAQWKFGTDGTTTFPSNLQIVPHPIVDGTYIAQDNGILQLATSGNTSATSIGWGQDPLSPGNIALMNFNFNESNAVEISTGFVMDPYTWTFGNTGTLTLPDTTTVYAGFINGGPSNHTAGISTYSGWNQVYAQDSDVAVQTSTDGNVYYTWTFSTSGTLTTPGNVTIGTGYGNISMVHTISANNYVYANGVSILANITGGASTGNITFDGLLISLDAGTTSAANTYITIAPNVEGYAFLQLPNDVSANVSNTRLWNVAGNVEISSGDFSNAGDTYTWIFGKDGRFNLPNGGAIGAIETADSIDLYGDSGAQYVQLNWNDTNFVYVDSTGAHMQTTGYEISLAPDGTTTFPDHKAVSITGNLTVGNLTVNGNITYIGTNSYVVTDNIVQFADGNPADILDLGFTAHRTVGGVLQHTGLIRDSSAGNWKLFSNVIAQPGATVDFANVIYDNLWLGSLKVNSANSAPFSSGDALYVTGGITAGVDIAAGGRLVACSFATSTNINSGAIQTNGGIGAWGNIYAGQNVVATGNVSATYFIGNGALLTGIVSGSNYGNTDVASYLPTYSGNVQAGNVNLTSNSSAVTFNNGAYIYGDQVNRIGSIVLQPAASGTFPSVIVGGAGRLAAPNGSVHMLFNTSDLTVQVQQKITVGTSSSSTTNGALVVTGGVGVSGNINAGGNVTAGGATTTGIGAIVAGAPNTLLPNTVASFSANVNNYTQLTLQNKSTGADATADIVITSDAGSDTTNYADFGIINSGYDNATPTNSLGNVVFANDTYLYAQGNTASTVGGNLAIGTTTASKSVKIFAGGNTASAVVATVSNTGLAVTGNITSTANVTAAYFVTTGGFGNISQVDTITANTGVYSGNITASGIAGFYAPNRPGFRVTGPGGQLASVAQVAGANLVVDFNQGSHLNTTTGYFTAPVAGLYQVNLVVRTFTNSGVSAQAVIEKNNSTVIIMVEWAANTTMNHTGGSTVTKLAVGDTLRFRVLLGSISFDANDNWSVAYLG